jgi:hypothetical protein
VIIQLNTESLSNYTNKFVEKYYFTDNDPETGTPYRRESKAFAFKKYLK